MQDRSLPPRLLIVDDEKAIADSLAQIFTKHGFEARAVYLAEQALDCVAEWLPAIAIVDVILPNMNGIELAKALKAQEPSMQVLLITGQIIGNVFAEAMARDGNRFDVLMKPIPVPALLENTKRLLANLSPSVGTVKELESSH
jgi:DNA-binding NtrC family response regulator